MGVSEGEKSCLSLDQKLLRFMDQLELLEKKRASLNSLIEQGWFSMTQARYSMGNKHVSALQYANEMEPLVRVHVRTLDSDEVEFCTERAAQKDHKESIKDLTSVEDIGPQEEGIRRRKTKGNNATEKKTGEDVCEEKVPDGNPSRGREHDAHQDPLMWFGILVPQSLKQAQSSFKQVIELSAEIAALQIEVLNSRKELKSGLKNQLCAGEQFTDHDGQLRDSTGSETSDATAPSAAKSP